MDGDDEFMRLRTITTPLLDLASYVQPLGPFVSLVPFGPLESVSVTVAQEDPNGWVVPLPRVKFRTTQPNWPWVPVPAGVT
jgi:hypothetical protein